MKHKIILASASPRRKELLGDICPDFTVITANIDEKSLPGELPEELVMRLSREKARAVWERTGELHPRVVIGADTVVVLDGEIMGKPADAADARRMLKALSGRTHQVFTGVTLLWEGGQETFSGTAQVEFYPLTDEEIDGYISAGEPFGKAGAYAIQLLGKRFIREIHGDYSAIVGLPAGQVYHRLVQNGLLTVEESFSRQEKL